MSQIMGQQAITPGSESSEASLGSKVEEELPEGLQSRNVKTRDGMTKLYGLMGTIVFGFNKVDGILILQEAEQRATELVLVAQHHPKMLKVLKMLAKGNDYVTCGVGHAGILLSVLINHERVPISPFTEGYAKNVVKARATVAAIEAGLLAEQQRASGTLQTAMA